MKNQHAQIIPADVLNSANEKIDELHALLSPYTITLTEEERLMMPKIGEKNLSFVVKAGELASKNEDLCPPYLDVDDFAKDMGDMFQLRPMANRLHQILSGVEDTLTVAGSEAFNAALVFYSSVKTAAMQGVPGAKDVRDELKKRFPGRGRPKFDTTE